MEKENLNFNYSECIKSYDKWGETVYQNICTGETTKMPWGVSGYGILLLILIVIVVFGCAITMMIKMIKDFD